MGKETESAEATTTLPSEAGDPSPKVTILGWIVVTLFLVLLVGVSAPATALLGEGQYAFVSAVHGMLATLGVVAGSVAIYLTWKLALGRIKAFNDLRILSLASTFVCASTIIFGNWIYIAYRASGGPREYFLQNSPLVHNVFFEFKEFIALFTLPLAVAGTFVIWRYGRQLVEDKPLRTWLFTALIVAWGALMVAFLLGAAITKLRGV